MQNVFTIKNLTILPLALAKLSVNDIQRAVMWHQNGEYIAVSDTVYESRFCSNKGLQFHLVTDFDKEESFLGFLNENPGSTDEISQQEMGHMKQVTNKLLEVLAYCKTKEEIDAQIEQMSECDFDSLVGKKVILVDAAFTDCGKEIPADTLCEVLVYKPDYLLLQAFLVGGCYDFYVENSADSIRLPAVVVAECDAFGEEI